MGLRFRRSLKLAPGVRLNFSASGLSLSAGPRGASVTFGSRGTYLNTGIPGTGISSRTRLDSPARTSHTSAAPQKVQIDVRIQIDDDGKLTFEYNGKPANDYIIAKAKREHGDEIRAMIAGACEKMNARIHAVTSIHLRTPPPTARIEFKRQLFDEAEPRPPVPKGHGFLGGLFKGIAAKIDAANESAKIKYQEQLAEWKARKTAFEAQEADREDFLERRIISDPLAMEQHFEHALHDIDWPRETHAAFEIQDSGKAIAIDVDLPKIDDMPKVAWNLPAHSFKPTIKQLTETQRNTVYAEHAQGVGFRIMGEAFAILPTLETVTLSAYTQRPSTATGSVQDEYVYSVKATRDLWSRINFGNLEAVSVGDALAQFDLRRQLTKTLRMQPIEPIVVRLSDKTAESIGRS